MAPAVYRFWFFASLPCMSMVSRVVKPGRFCYNEP